MVMNNTLTFLGTAGARVMVANQNQASGGLWLNLQGVEILIDPGPGSIVQSSRRNLKAEKLQAIILTHRHLDHSGDMNIMVEAMTQGGFARHGMVFLPSDALGPEPVIYSYLKKFIDELVTLEEGKSYRIGPVSFSTPVRHIHGVETYGLKFQVGANTFAYIADSRFFEGLVDHYRADILLINVVFMDNRFKIDHLSAVDVETIVERIRPRVAILSHFGMQIWQANPLEVAARLTQKTGIPVIAARDGLVFDLDNIKQLRIENFIPYDSGSQSGAGPV
jgi:phosphoribosyl 1,2-cyclic phosphodiesterase